jgi:predicted metal-binding membrane protein
LKLEQAIRSPAGDAARQRTTIIVLLLLVAGAGWLVVGWQGARMESNERMLTMGMGFPAFLGIWSLMMAAMMLPAASPMVDAFVRVQSNRRAAGNAYVSPVIFVAGYLLVWCSTGIAAFVLARWLEDAAMKHMWLMDNGARLGGGLIAAAGIYQLSPLKRTCLGKCRTPMSFVATSWRDGTLGAVRMGIEHGAFCLGCCWLLFAILFPLGIMNIAVMAAVTALILFEKVLPQGFRAAVLAGLALVAYGLLVVAMPDTLPSMT